jgi:hypothetical protein
MKRLHLIVGMAAAAAFLATGLYMHFDRTWTPAVGCAGPADADVLINFRPMDAQAITDKLLSLALLGSCLGQPPRPQCLGCAARNQR